MKFQKFIIILVGIMFGLAACRNNTPTEEEISGQVPETYNYASGSLGYPVFSNNVGIEVIQAGLPAGQENSNPDYVQVLLEINVTNESGEIVIPPSMTLVDDHRNFYTTSQEELPYESQLTRMPNIINPGEEIAGQLVYIIPLPATQDNLRLRWESESHESRIDIFLGPVGQRAIPGATPTP